MGLCDRCLRCMERIGSGHRPRSGANPLRRNTIHDRTRGYRRRATSPDRSSDATSPRPDSWIIAHIHVLTECPPRPRSLVQQRVCPVSSKSRQAACIRGIGRMRLTFPGPSVTVAPCVSSARSHATPPRDHCRPRDRDPTRPRCRRTRLQGRNRHRPRGRRRRHPDPLHGREDDPDMTSAGHARPVARNNHPRYYRIQTR